MTTDQNTSRELPASQRRYARRALMLGAAVAGAGAAASLAVPGPAEASNGKPVLLGEPNTATAATSVSNADGDGFAGSTSAAGHSGIRGNDTGRGGYGLAGFSVNGIGVHGRSAHGAAIVGEASNAVGVYGSSVNATGVFAKGPIALAVDGPAIFSTSGIATVKQGTQSVTVTLAAAAASSVVLATIQQDRAGITVQSAVPIAGSFTITLTGKPAADTNVGWFVLELP